jgi:hypothetical protein
MEIPFSLVALLIFGAFFVGIIVLAVWLVRRAGQEQARRRAQLQSFGFQPLPQLNPEVAAAIAALLPRVRPNRLRYRNIAYRADGLADLFCLDILDTGGDDDSTLAHEAVAVYSSRLNLPLFSLTPRLAMPGKLAALANQLLERLAAMTGPVIAFAGDPDFAAQFIVSGSDAAAVTALLDDYVTERLSAFRDNAVQFGGPMILIAPIQAGEAGRANLQAPGDPLARRIAQARALFELFRSE